MNKEQYQEYLQTPEWKNRRQWALDRCGNKCQVCGSADGLDVHHNTYERLGEELPHDLTGLCRDCHEKFHGQEKDPPTFIAIASPSWSYDQEGFSLPCPHCACTPDAISSSMRVQCCDLVDTAEAQGLRVALEFRGECGHVWTIGFWPLRHLGRIGYHLYLIPPNPSEPPPKPPPSPPPAPRSEREWARRCSATTWAGTQCRNEAAPDKELCTRHVSLGRPPGWTPPVKPDTGREAK